MRGVHHHRVLSTKSCFIVELVVLLAVVLNVCEVNGWKFFHLGRHWGGNLGEPATGGGCTSSVDDTHKRKGQQENDDLRRFPDTSARRQSRRHQDNIKVEWFEQILNHFDSADIRTWKQRYFSNDAYYQRNGPVFLMIGGEGEASIKWMNAGSWVDYAQENNAYLFQLEHRYYGQSHPTEDLSTENLKFLSSEQALADLATFIVAMNRQHQFPTGTRWIAFGGSYPGNLAAWIRYKYPHLVHASVSSSGPVLAQVDFQEYYHIVAKSLATHNASCVSAIYKGFNQMHSLLKGKLGQQSVEKIFKLCDNITDLTTTTNNKNSELDVSNLYESIAGNFAGVVQYNRDNRISSTDRKSHRRPVDIDEVCEIMENQTLGTPVERLGQVNDLMLNTTNQTCLDFRYAKMVAEMQNTSWQSETGEGGARQWTYQTCTEFGYYQTSSFPRHHIFGDQFPVEFFIRQCQDVFERAAFNATFLARAVRSTNTNYAGLRPQLSRVLFVHGTIDPWHALGITNDLNQWAPAILIKGTAHCANMYPASKNDTIELREARLQIRKTLRMWLKS